MLSFLIGVAVGGTIGMLISAVLCANNSARDRDIFHSAGEEPDGDK